MSEMYRNIAVFECNYVIYTKYTTPFHTIQIYIASEGPLPPSGKSWQRGVAERSNSFREVEDGIRERYMSGKCGQGVV